MRQLHAGRAERLQVRAGAGQGAAPPATLTPHRGGNEGGVNEVRPCMAWPQTHGGKELKEGMGRDPRDPCPQAEAGRRHGWGIFLLGQAAKRCQRFHDLGQKDVEQAGNACPCALPSRGFPAPLHALNAFCSSQLSPSGR